MNLFDEKLIKDNFNDKINILKKNNKVISFFYLLKKKDSFNKTIKYPISQSKRKAVSNFQDILTYT